MSETKTKRPTARQDRDAELDKTVAAMRGWNELSEACDCPADLAIAFITGRSELLKLAKPRAMTEAEVAVLYNFIRVQMQTILQLQRHSQLVANHARDMETALRGLRLGMDELNHFANFRNEYTEN